MSQRAKSTLTVFCSAGAATLILVSYFSSRKSKNGETNEDDVNNENESQNQDLKITTQKDAGHNFTVQGNYDNIYEENGPRPFEFNSEVVDVFDDMISRSVPLYREVLDLAVYWVRHHYVTGTAIYDLGCSTGSLLHVLAKSFGDVQLDNSENVSSSTCRMIGIDNSLPMVEACRKKLQWAQHKGHNIEILCSDILELKIENASFVLMNYTLQFIPVVRRQDLLCSIYNGLCDGGIIFLSEKVRMDCAERQEICTWIYENFKERKNYTKREIARKKEALTNVLVPYTEKELTSALGLAGFVDVEIISKWNNFTTFIAKKPSTVFSAGKDRKPKKNKKTMATPNLDNLFNSSPTYLSNYVDPKKLYDLCQSRIEAFLEKGNLSFKVLQEYDEIAALIQKIPCMRSKRLKFDIDHLTIGDPKELTSCEMKLWEECASRLKPWKKGPLDLFGIRIDTEWRSDLKWNRLKSALPPMEDKVVCDIGCGNGYFMYRMLEYNPKFVIGLDPNLHAFLEFKIFQRFSGVENVHFELLRGDSLAMFSNVFDVVFCLGVLYHTHDPIGMLRTIHNSMKKGSTLIIDCQGIPGEESCALFPHKRYANMRGVYFLPTLSALKNWLHRTNFVDIEVIFAEKLEPSEQRITDWAPMHKSLQETLCPDDSTKTIEGYPAPHRFYIRVTA